MPLGASLRLAIGREGVGIELGEPAALGFGRVTELLATFRGVRFPADVSGGVDRFRHRRGDLARLELDISAGDLERWAAPRLRGVLTDGIPEVWIGVGEHSACVCVSVSPAADDQRTDPAPLVAFDVHVMADGDDLILVVDQARGVDLPAPATAVAVACLRAATRKTGDAAGAAYRIRGAAGQVVRAVFPEAGARAPSASRVRWAGITTQPGGWVLRAGPDLIEASPTETAVRAHEVATLLRRADEVLLGGDLAGARTAAIEALERAPRHMEIIRRVLEIDAFSPGRAEAALGLLAQAPRGAIGAHLGTLPGELRARANDRLGAIASWERTGDTDPAPALAARAFELAAKHIGDPEAAARYLDRALSLWPRATAARWARVAVRLSLSRLEEALGDVEHLDALVTRSEAKYGVWTRAGRAWQVAGLGTRAGPIFERALRYEPDEPTAIAGLGVALVFQGYAARGVALLSAAAQKAADKGLDTSGLELDLARAFADGLDDRPAAIAHASMIAGAADEALVARGLEGRWRAQLGDLVGASLSFARMRELATARSGPHSHTGEEIELLLEAASFEREQRGDLLAAQRHLAVALRLRPLDRAVQRAYAEVGAAITGLASPATGAYSTDAELARAGLQSRPTKVDGGPAPVMLAEDAPEPVGARPIPTAARFDFEAALDPSAEDPAQTARVEALSRALQADPRNDAIADELALLLEQLDRGHELLALLSARLEDADPLARPALLPRVRAALDRLAKTAARRGQHEEAALIRGVLESMV